MFGHKDKKTFFERLTGSVSVADRDDELVIVSPPSGRANSERRGNNWPTSEEDEEIGELAIDVCEKPNEIIIQAMVAGVKPENMDIDIARQSVTITGRRERISESDDGNYHKKELYWGSFARTIELPAEVDPDSAEAFEKHGLLTIKLPRIDKERKQKVKIRTI